MAQSNGDDWDGGFGMKSERRSNLLLGVDLGLGLGQVSGYPRDAVKVDDPRYLSDTGFTLGRNGAFYVGGAFTDWFSFSLGARFETLTKGITEASGGAALLRVETFPLYAKGGRWRDLGVGLEGGLGWMKSRKHDEVVAHLGSPGNVGLTLFHETWRWGGLTVGPSLAYTHQFSETGYAHLGMIGLRAAYYTGP